MDASPRIEGLRERVEALQARHGYRILDADAFGAYADQAGTALFLFLEDPAKVPESWDLAVIAPEALARFAAGARVGVLLPEAARPVAKRFGISVWPALLALRDGEYLGAIEGLKDWAVYASLIPQLLAAPSSRPPGIGIPVVSADAGRGCH